MIGQAVIESPNWNDLRTLIVLLAVLIGAAPVILSIGAAGLLSPEQIVCNKDQWVNLRVLLMFTFASCDIAPAAIIWQSWLSLLWFDYHFEFPDVEYRL